MLENEDVLAELGRYRDAGLAIGLSVSGPRQAETILRAIDVTVGGEPLFASVQATWNLLETSAGDALRQANEAGMGVIIKEGLANGRLTARNNDPAFAEQRALLESVAAELNTTLDALALAAVLAQPWCDIVLSGAARVDHLQSNVAAFDVPWTDEIADRLSTLREPPEVYWKTRSSLKWQ